MWTFWGAFGRLEIGPVALPTNSGPHFSPRGEFIPRCATAWNEQCLAQVVFPTLFALRNATLWWEMEMRSNVPLPIWVDLQRRRVC
jgi:hypothetical protein